MWVKFKIAVVVLGLFSPIVHSMRFDFYSGITKCIAEDLRPGSMSVGKYTVVNPNAGYPLPDTQKISVRVTSPEGINDHIADHVESGNFAFTAGEAGDYMACFWAPDHKPAIAVSVDFDWRSGVSAYDWSKVAKKGNIEIMELELKKMYDTATSLHHEMFYLREREEEMEALNRATNSQMATFSFLSLLVCLSVAGLQLRHLKTFFERKKLL